MRDEEEVYHRNLPKLDDTVPDAKPIQPVRTKETVQEFYNSLKLEHPLIANQIGRPLSHRRNKYLFIEDPAGNIGFMRFTIWDKHSCKVYVADGQSLERSRAGWNYKKAIVSLDLTILDTANDEALHDRCLKMIKDYDDKELETYFKHRNFILGAK